MTESTINILKNEYDSLGATIEVQEQIIKRILSELDEKLIAMKANIVILNDIGADLGLDSYKSDINGEQNAIQQ